MKNPFVGGHDDRFEGRRASGDKNQYKFFCRHRCFEYFSFNNIFEKKNNIFQNEIQKLFLEGVTMFEVMVCPKINIAFFWGVRMGYQIQFSSFFLKKRHTV